MLSRLGVVRPGHPVVSAPSVDVLLRDSGTFDASRHLITPASAPVWLLRTACMHIATQGRINR